MKKILAFIFCILCVNAYADEWEDFLQAQADDDRITTERCYRLYGENCHPSAETVRKSHIRQAQEEERRKNNIIEYSWVEGSTQHRCVIDNNWHTKKCN